MKVLIRKTITGSEYWDNEKKKTLFVPKGKEPEFEVTKYSYSLHTHKMIIPDNSEEEKERPKRLSPQRDPENFSEMNIEDLMLFAQQNGIEVPGNMKKFETIKKHIEEELKTAADASDTK